MPAASSEHSARKQRERLPILCGQSNFRTLRSGQVRGIEVLARVYRVQRTVDRVLDVAAHGVDPGKRRLLDAGRPTSGGNAPVRAGLDDGPEAWQPVGRYFCIRRKVLARPAAERMRHASNKASAMVILFSPARQQILASGDLDRLVGS